MAEDFAGQKNLKKSLSQKLLCPMYLHTILPSNLAFIFNQYTWVYQTINTL